MQDIEASNRKIEWLFATLFFFYLRKIGFSYLPPESGGRGAKSGVAAGAQRPPSGGAKGSRARAAKQAKGGKERQQVPTPQRLRRRTGGRPPGGRGEGAPESKRKRKAPQGEGELNVINLKQPLNGRQNVWKYQKGEGKSDSDGREKDVG